MLAAEPRKRHGDRIHVWDGKEWTVSTPFPGQRFSSISKGASGELWAVVHASKAGNANQDGQLKRREGKASSWADVTLPVAAHDSCRYSRELVPMESHQEKASAHPLHAWSVDATGSEEVLVIAGDDTNEGAWVLCPRARELRSLTFRACLVMSGRGADAAEIAAAMKSLAQFAPRHLCGQALVDREP